MTDSKYLLLCGILFLSGCFGLIVFAIANKHKWPNLSKLSGMFASLMLACSIGGFLFSAAKFVFLKVFWDAESEGPTEIAIISIVLTLLISASATAYRKVRLKNTDIQRWIISYINPSTGERTQGAVYAKTLREATTKAQALSVPGWQVESITRVRRKAPAFRHGDIRRSNFVEKNKN